MKHLTGCFDSRIKKNLVCILFSVSEDNRLSVHATIVLDYIFEYLQPIMPRTIHCKMRNRRRNFKLNSFKQINELIVVSHEA